MSTDLHSGLDAKADPSKQLVQVISQALQHAVRNTSKEGSASDEALADIDIEKSGTVVTGHRITMD